MKKLWYLGIVVMAASAWGFPSEQAWRELEVGALPKAWEELFDSLQGPDVVRADFVEERRNRIRPRPSYFDGDLIYAPDEGLSLRYDAMLESVIVLDRQGMMRRTEGGERQLADAAASADLVELLLQVFAFDLPYLAERFAFEGQRGPEGAWALRLHPRGTLSGDADPVVRKVELRGHGGLVEEIFFDRSVSFSVRIWLKGHSRGEALTEAERRKRFR